MKIKEVDAKAILDSRGDETIEVLIKTGFGTFAASSPFGKSIGKFETPAFINGIKGSIKTIKNSIGKIKEVEIESFYDLIEIENAVGKKNIGANTLYALELAILKALATEQDKRLWQVVNPKAKYLPIPIGNCIGGGLHSQNKKKPEFQEFHIIPKIKHFSDAVYIMRKCHEICGKRLELLNAKGRLNDENAWSTTLDNESVLKIMEKTRDEVVGEVGREIDLGIDVAASSFYQNGNYVYKNPEEILNKQEQLDYLARLAGEYELIYIEDPFHEEDWQSFGMLKERVRKENSCLIVGDDLTASQFDRIKEFIKKQAISGVILKPNQNGSIIELKEISDFAKNHAIKVIVSHRSGETNEYALADLAFAFGADYIKTGIIGKEREIKLQRMIEIEKEVNERLI